MKQEVFGSFLTVPPPPFIMSLPPPRWWGAILIGRLWAKAMKKGKLRRKYWTRLSALAGRGRFFFIAEIFLLAFLSLYLVARIFLADTAFAKGLSFKRRAEAGLAVKSFRRAVKLNPYEPAYRRELAFSLAQQIEGSLLLGKDFEEATLLASEAGEEAAAAFKLNPFNSLTLKSILKTYYDLAEYFPVYQERAEEVGEHLLELAPTEARSHYAAALVYAAGGENKRALMLTRKALELKPDFAEAQELEELLTHSVTLE